MYVSFKGYFWFSQKQKDVQRGTAQFGNRHPLTFCKLDNGKIVEYTEKTDEPKPFGLWDDYIALGHGEYHHSAKY